MLHFPLERKEHPLAMRIPGMTRVHPNVIATNNNSKRKVDEEEEPRRKGEEVVLTVWKKSLLFNCNGYTVFDGKGNLIYRVDNYMAASGSNGHILLMDASGNPLHTIHRKRLGLGESWLVYEGESSENPRFTARKHILRSPGKCMLAHVAPLSGDCTNTYEIEGSYAQRSCTIYNCGPVIGNSSSKEEKKKRRVVAEIKNKEAAVGGVALGCDVFRLVVWPHLIDSSLAMAFVILLDQMFA